MTRLLIARHGNTFESGETPIRIGSRTDLPLTEKGREQARRLGFFLVTYFPQLAVVYSSELQRTQEMAHIALATAKIAAPLHSSSLAMLNEIDYGCDEGKTDAEVIARIGFDALTAWEQFAAVPSGWLVDPEKIKRDWQQLAEQVKLKYTDKTVLIITSNGIARFALSLIPEKQKDKLTSVKMATGAVSSLVFADGQWNLEYWDRRIG